MKKAIGYIRISTSDQSNFSLEGQERYIREYAAKHGIELVSLFKDDGQSAKTFDRPDWKMLEAFIAKHYSGINYLIVAKYDRFSRNAAEGLQKIELLERKYRIIIVSVFEQMFIDYDSPFFFKQRADMLVNAEFELHVIRDRTRFGMHQALSSGRYISKAPFGYINTRDENNKPIIVPDADRAPIIVNIFQNYLSGMPLKEIYRQAARQGLMKKGNSCIPRILSNCVYAGLINVPAYKKEAQKYVKGLHEGIISEATWWEVQRRLGNVKQQRTILNESVPLRGVLSCFCGKPFTAGNSRGKRNYYWYYKCNEHKETNLPAKKLHNQFDEILKHLSLTDFHLQYLREAAEREMKLDMKDRSHRLEQKKKQHAEAVRTLEQLEEKFITGQVNTDTYKKWYPRYASKEAQLREELDQLQQNIQFRWRHFFDALPRLQDIHWLYHRACLTDKQALIREVFNSQLSYSGGVYRTPYLIELLSHNKLILKKKRLLLVEQPQQKLQKMEDVPQAGLQLNTFHSFLQLVNKIKVA